MKQVIIFLVFGLFLITVPIVGENPALFDSDTILELELKYNIKKFSKDKSSGRSEHPAKLSFFDSLGQRVTLDIKIRIRGKMRRMLLKCRVPVFKMKFDKSQTTGTMFQGQKSLKLVTHCKTSPKFFQHYMFQEYLIYKMFTILTDFSYRVRLAKITYIDSIKKVKPFTKYTFFIESSQQLAERLKAKAVDDPDVRLRDMDFETSTLVSVFEYMIGNTDFSIGGGHNIKLFTIGENPKYYPVPFDFDQSGLIDAYYARPDEVFPIRSVRERLFRGYNKNEAQFNKTFAICLRHKHETYRLYRDFPFLPEKVKKRSLKYLESFYEIIKNRKLVRRYFINNYRGRPWPKR